MLDALTQLGVFTAEAIIIALMVIIVLFVFLMLIGKGKERKQGKLHIKNLNHKYNEMRELMLAETMNKKQFKDFQKNKKREEKEKEKKSEPVKNIFVLSFHGDIKASAVSFLKEEITAILNVATPNDEVLLRLESAGGVVHGYGLAAAELIRLRAKNIPLMIAIDKVAASGGYLMACVANKILAAPFAIIGSIGVIVQLPNFHRLLKDKDIDFEMHTAGEFKRTITVFGENTEEGREKLQQEIEDIHGHFKHLIKEYRPQININQVATGEHWLAMHARTLDLVDELGTSEDYLFSQSKTAHIFEICHEVRKPLLARLTGSANIFNSIISLLGK